MAVKYAKDPRKTTDAGINNLAKVNDGRRNNRGSNTTFWKDEELTEEQRAEKRRKLDERNAKIKETKKQRRDMRECLLTVLDAEVANAEQREKLRKALGLKNDDFIDNKLLVNFALFKQALKGDVSAIRQIQQMVGVESNIPVNQQITINIEPYQPSSQPALLDFESEEDWE